MYINGPTILLVKSYVVDYYLFCLLSSGKGVTRFRGIGYCYCYLFMIFVLDENL